jgi:hypothetical protein
MLTDKEMLEIAERYLTKVNASEKDVLVVLPDLTIKKSYGNVYYFDFKKFMETGDAKYAVFGGAPFLVEKERRRVVQFGTIGSIEDQILAYEAGTLVPALDTYWYPDEDRFSHK